MTEDNEVAHDHVQDGCFELLSSGLFTDHRNYVRRQFIHSLIQVCAREDLIYNPQSTDQFVRRTNILCSR